MTDLAVPPEETAPPAAVPSSRAVNLASPTKTVAMWEGITPRWLLQFLQYVEVKAGIYRVNRVAEPARSIACRAIVPRILAPARTLPDRVPLILLRPMRRR